MTKAKVVHDLKLEDFEIEKIETEAVHGKPRDGYIQVAVVMTLTARVKVGDIRVEQESSEEPS